MTSSPQSIIESLHKLYCDSTGTEPKPLLWERSWYDYLQAGFNLSDLEIVLKWIKRENSIRDFKRSLNLGKLIGGDLTHFDSLLCEARAVQRNHKPVTAKQKVVQEFRRFQESEVPAAARQIGQIIQQFKEI